MITHPKSGLHYVHVIPSAWGPYVDIRACYLVASLRSPWISVINEAEFAAHMAGPLYQDDTVMFVLWSEMDPGPRNQRRAYVVPVYSEALDDRLDNMLPGHVHVWSSFGARAPHYDAVFAHTPWMASMMRHVSLDGFVLPVGWEPEAMGRPRSALKTMPITFHGSKVGRRAVLLPFLFERLRGVLHDVSGMYGRGLLGALDNSMASLYIAHSDVRSFSTWRLWQTVATGVALIAEHGDSWPFDANRHYITIPKLELANAEGVVDYLRDLVGTQHDQLLAVSTAVQQDLADRFTTQRCIEDYLVPASIRIKELAAAARATAQETTK